MNSALDAANAGFTAIYVIEMLLKWTALGIRLYFRVICKSKGPAFLLFPLHNFPYIHQDGWCQFDFLVVVLSVAVRWEDLGLLVY